MKRDLEGKVMLVTGATEGIGKAAAVDFAKRGATLILVGRNREKTERVVDELKSVSGNEHIDFLLGDVSKFADIREIAASFKAKYDRLDVLANNAGAMFSSHQLSEDGYEMTFAVNHLAYFLLTHELLDLLIKTPGSRIVSTSSDAHKSGHVNLTTIATRKSKRAGFKAYCDSKLANVLFSRELAKRLSGKGVKVTCFHPGFVQTRFAQNNPGVFAMVVKFVASLFARTPEKGAETLIWLAASPESAHVSGQYFVDRAVGKISRRAKDDALAHRLWALSEKLCGLTPSNT